MRIKEDRVHGLIPSTRPMSRCPLLRVLSSGWSSARSSCTHLHWLSSLRHGAKVVWELWWRVELASSLKTTVVATSRVLVRVQKTIVRCHHLVVFGHEVVFSKIRIFSWGSRSVCRDIIGVACGLCRGKHGVRTCHTQAIDYNRELTEEVNDAVAALRQPEDE